MRCLTLIIIAWLVNGVNSFQCSAQSTYKYDDIDGYHLTLSNVHFDSTSGGVYSVPLRKYGLEKSNYSVIVTVEGESGTYHVPGPVHNGDSFDFLLKAGRKGNGDTLFIVRRTGTEPVLFLHINILAFRGSGHRGILPSDKGFTQFLINKYLSPGHADDSSGVAYYK